MEACVRDVSRCSENTRPPSSSRSLNAPGDIRVENSRYMGSTATSLYPALMDGQYILPGEHAPGHLSRTRRDLDRNLTAEEKVIGGWLPDPMNGGRSG